MVATVTALGDYGKRSSQKDPFAQFQINIVAAMHENSKNNIREANKLQEGLAASADNTAKRFTQASNAAKVQRGHLVNLSNKWKDLNKRLGEFSKLSWQGVAGGFLMGGAISHIAGWLDKAIAKVAIFGSELYYMNRRLGLPGTAGLYNVGFAGEQIGLERSSVLATTESMGATARLNPGVAALLSRFLPGYKAGGPIGGKEQLELVNALKKRFGEGGYYMAAQYSQQFGFADELQFRQFWVNIDESNKAFAEHQQRLKDLDINTDATSKSFAMFNRAWNNLTDVLELWATKIGANLASAATPVVNTLANAAQHPSLKARLIGKGIETAWDLAGSALSGINSGVSGAFNYFSGSNLSKEFNNPTVAKVNSTELFPGVSGAFNYFSGSNLSKEFNNPTVAKVNSTELFNGAQGSRQDAINTFLNMGVPYNAAVGFAYGLHAESGSKNAFIDYQEKNNIGGGHYGIMQWGKTRQKNFEKMFGHPLSSSTYEEQKQFMAWEAYGGDTGTTAAVNWAKNNPNAQPSEAVNIWNKRAEIPGQNYAADIYAGANQYAAQHPAINNDIDINNAGVNITINGGVTQDILDRTQSVLNDENQKQAMFMLNAVRGANFR